MADAEHVQNVSPTASPSPEGEPKPPITLSSPVAEKLKATFFLAISSNFTTMAGVVAAIVLLSKTDWIEGSLGKMLYACTLIPTLMGDALNAYVLGRIKLERDRGWEDIMIVSSARDALLRFMPIWRLLSMACAVALALILLTSYSPTPTAWAWLKPLFASLFILHILKNQHTLWTAFVPRVPILGGRAFWNRFFAVAFVAAGWLFWLIVRDEKPFSWIGFLLHGIIFFMLNALLQPLPSRFSIFRINRNSSVILREVQELPDGVPPPNGKDGLPLDIGPEGAREAHIWKTQLGFHPVGRFRMPLPELPLFIAAGEAHLSADGKTLVLILRSEIRKTFHRAIFSWVGDKTHYASDLGTPDARFPSGILFQTLSPKLAASEFFTSHRATYGDAGAEPVTCPPWGMLNMFCDRMFAFLAEELRSAKENSDRIMQGKDQTA
ncbi:MAG: hypothetical protein WA705_29555 [Candidatus Ozemobacteraceae bacterium]